MAAQSPPKHGLEERRETIEMAKVYAVTFVGFGLWFVWRGFHAGVWGAILIWIGISLLLVGLAYGGLGPRIFGKSPDGTMSPISVAVLLPYLLGTWIIWHIRRGISNDRVGQEILPAIWLGRRPHLNELPAGIALVIDLTAEFPADAALTRQVGYVCMPVLDGTAPPDAVFMKAVEIVLSQTQAVFVHCAVGHARSASVVAAVVIRRGLAADVDSAEAFIRQKRPRVRLNRAQRQQVHRLIVSQASAADPMSQ
jgi:protein-tyrosine phosphatase